MHGFRARGEHGVLQIDTAYQNYLLISKGTGSFTAKSGYTGFYFDVPVPSVRSLVAARTRLGKLFNMYGVLTTSGQVYQRFYSATSGGTLEFFIFDTEAAEGGTYGLRIRDDAGRLVYNSNNPTLKVVGVLPGESTSSDPWMLTENRTRNFSFPLSQRPLAIVFNGQGYAYFASGGSEVFRFYETVSTTTSVVTRATRWDSYESGGGVSPSVNDGGRAEGLVIDVGAIDDPA